jgi:hypothetical protein
MERLLGLPEPGRTGGDHLQAREPIPDLGVGGKRTQGLDGVHSEGEGIGG